VTKSIRTKAHDVQLTNDDAFRKRLDYELICQTLATRRRRTAAHLVEEALKDIRHKHGADLAASISHLDLSVEARAGVVMVHQEAWDLAGRLAGRFALRTPGRLGVTWSPRVVIIAALYSYCRAPPQ